jgi:putative membrane protein
MSTLFAFLHHLSAFTLVGALAIEFILIGQIQTKDATSEQGFSIPVAKRLVITDAVLGAAATILLIVGLLRVFFFEKGAAYYFHSHAFMAKLSIFIAVALLSIIPTVEFLSWRKALNAGQAPQVAPGKLRLIKKLLHGELMAVVLILLFAAIVARGGWV